MTTFRNPLADPLGTHRGPPLVRGPRLKTAALSDNNTAKRGDTNLHRSCTLLQQKFATLQ